MMFRYFLVLMVCLTVWLCCKEICKCAAACELIHSGMKLTPRK